MKILIVIIVILVLVSSVFAADTVWESGWPQSLVPWIYVHEGVPASKHNVTEDTKYKVKAQEPQHYASNTMPLIDPQPSANQLQNAKNGDDEKEEEKELVDWVANDIQRDLVVVGIFTAVSQLVVLVVQLVLLVFTTHYTRESVKIANRSLRVAHRAYLSVERFRLDKFEVNAEGVFHCILHNAGQTPAHLVSRHIGMGVDKILPPHPDYARVEKKLRSGVIHPHKDIEIFTFFSPPDPEVYARYEPGGETLYFFGCFVYRDEFKDKHEVGFYVFHERSTGKLMLVDNPDYNYAT